MNGTNSYVETMDRFIVKYLCAPDPGSLYALLCVIFEGIAENYSLPTTTELNAEDMTFAPMFIGAENGIESLVVLTDLNGEELSVTANVKFRALLNLILSRESCVGIVFNPGTEKEYFIPKTLLHYAVLAGYRMAEDDYADEEEEETDEADEVMQNTVVNESGYYGLFDFKGNLIGAGKFIGGALGLYGPDGEFHYKPEYEKWFYEGDFDEISDEEFEKFKKKMDMRNQEQKSQEGG